MIFFTVTFLSEDGDTIPFGAAHRTQADAEAAAFADAEALGFHAVLGTPDEHTVSVITTVPDADGCYTDAWLIAQVSVA